MKQLSIIAILWLSIITCVIAATSSLNAQVDRDSIAVNETLTFTLTATGQLGASMPDFSPLTQDFTILSTQQVSQISVIQGKSATQLSWTLTLSPKTKGNLVIPAFQVGSDSSQPIRINVTEGNTPTESTSTTKENKKSLFINSSITPDNPYINAQALYTLQLFYQRNVQNAQLSPPHSPDAELIALGDDRHYRKTIEGEVYQVLERHYAVIPQQSGEITIEPSLLTGDMASPDDDLFAGNFFTLPGQPVSVSGKPLMLKVRPKPESTNAQWWLPAQKLQVSEQWSATPSQVRVGEPITRTITIEALGVTAAQLPDLPIPNLPNLQVYPDKPILETIPEGTTLKAKKIIKYALIPNQPGEINLPELNINWWNTGTDKAENTKLAAQKLQAIAVKSTTSSPPQVTSTPIANPPPVSTVAPLSAPTTSPLLLWQGLTAGFALLWLITLSLWLFKKKNPNNVPTDAHEKANNKTQKRQIIDKLKQACLTNDSPKAQQYLLHFASLQWPDSPPINLGDIEKRITQASLKEALRQLDKQLYTGTNTFWDGKQFWEAFQNEFANKVISKSNEEKDALPNLYQ